MIIDNFMLSSLNLEVARADDIFIIYSDGFKAFLGTIPLQVKWRFSDRMPWESFR